MATIKSYTDIEQSKKLTDILPLESADMIWANDNDIIVVPYDMATRENVLHDFIPCWSLSALLGVLLESKICHYNDRYYCQQMSEGDEFPRYSTAEYDNPIDACYEMILKLHEFNLL